MNVVDMCMHHVKHKLKFELDSEKWRDFDPKVKKIVKRKWFIAKFLNEEGDALNEEINSIPDDKGGIYLFLLKPEIIPHRHLFILYIGRARRRGEYSLRKRCRTYFTDTRPKIAYMREVWGKPENIDSYCRPTCVALDRAFYFFQVRCGIREINEINYALMIPLVAYILHEDKFYNGEKAEKVFNLLEAWYWASIFSGSYDRNQNTVMMSDLNHLIINTNDIVNNKITNLDWLKERIDRILNAERFSEKDFMVHEKASIGEYPKKVMQLFVCQYYLTKGYYDLIEKTDANNNKSIEQINVFSPSSNQLEMHHVIALGAVNSVNQSSKSLRKNPAHYLNSPLNMLYISKDANKEISAKSLQDYSSAIPTQSNLSLVGFTQTDLDYNATEEKKKESLKKRHENLQAEMTRETLNLISGL